MAIINNIKISKRKKQLLGYWIVEPALTKPTKNSRFLEARNKREGWYFGKINLPSGQWHRRTWSKPASIRYSHIQFGQVRFQGLGIQLHTPTGEPNGNT